MKARARRIGRKTVFSGRMVKLVIDQVIEPGNVRTAREVVIHGGSVVILAKLPDGKLLLVRQFRYAARKPLWELVAGGIEPGETPLEAARRELEEETGFRAKAVKPLFTFFPSPGVLTERMHLVEASGLTRARTNRDPDERIRVGRFTSSEIERMLFSRHFEDGKTLVGLLWLFCGRAERPKSRKPKSA